MIAVRHGLAAVRHAGSMCAAQGAATAPIMGTPPARAHEHPGPPGKCLQAQRRLQVAVCVPSYRVNKDALGLILERSRCSFPDVDVRFECSGIRRFCVQLRGLLALPPG